MLGEFKGKGRGNLRIERRRDPRPGDSGGPDDPGGEDAGDFGVAVGGAQGVGVAVVRWGGGHAAAPATGRGMRGLVTGELCSFRRTCTGKSMSARLSRTWCMRRVTLPKCPFGMHAPLVAKWSGGRPDDHAEHSATRPPAVEPHWHASCILHVGDLEGGPSKAIEPHAVVPAALCRSFTPYASARRIDDGFMSFPMSTALEKRQ